jgi:UDP-2,3-diacylglucosamine pyrophosphatase LpxH
LLKEIRKGNSTRGSLLPFDVMNSKWIILSDQHKGTRDAADDFLAAEENYVAALDYYFANDYHLACLGDSEELWENTPATVLKSYPECLQSEVRFLHKNQFIKIFGNHDLEWSYTVPQLMYLKDKYGPGLKIQEGLLLTVPYNDTEYSIFMAHGHQGDKRSDGSAFSKWFVATIWTPLQRFLEVKSTTTSDSFELGDRHNIMMYEWSATHKNLLFISGHTHKPVFASLDHIERINKALVSAKQANDIARIQKLEAELKKRASEYAGKQFIKTMVAPSYFNSGCCCFSDGDITGIEIAEGEIRLVKWKYSAEENAPTRRILEYAPLPYIFDSLTS